MERLEVFVSVGEASSDVHASEILPHLQSAFAADTGKEIHFWGIAGPKMRSQGVEAFLKTEDQSVMGVWEVAKSYTQISKSYRDVLHAIETRKPSAVILFDYPSYHLRLAQDAYERGLTVIYCISPKFWAHGWSRVEKLRDYTHHVISILPFEMPWLKEAGVDASFLGNPVVDTARQYRLREFGKNDLKQMTLGMVPGSRRFEVENTLPVMLESFFALRERPGFELIEARVSVAPTISKSMVMKMIDDAVRWFGGGSKELRERITIHATSLYETLNGCSYAWVASGTAAFETSFLRIPHSVVYRVNPVTYVLGRLLVRHIQYISLANLCLNKQVVPEWLQELFTVENLTRHAHSVLTTPAIREEMLHDFEALEALFPGESAKRIGQLVSQVIQFYNVSAEDKFRLHRHDVWRLYHHQNQQHTLTQ